MYRRLRDISTKRSDVGKSSVRDHEGRSIELYLVPYTGSGGTFPQGGAQAALFTPD